MYIFSFESYYLCIGIYVRYGYFIRKLCSQIGQVENSTRPRLESNSRPQEIQASDGTTIPELGNRVNSKVCLVCIIKLHEVTKVRSHYKL